MSRERIAYRWLLVGLWIGLVGIQIAIAAGCGASARNTALQYTRDSTNAARDAFVAWNAAHEQDIVAKATSLDDGKTKLAAYRAKRAKVDAALVAAYNAMMVAAALNDTSGVNVAAAVKALSDEIAALTGGSP